MQKFEVEIIRFLSARRDCESDRPMCARVQPGTRTMAKIIFEQLYCEKKQKIYAKKAFLCLRDFNRCQKTD